MSAFVVLGEETKFRKVGNQEGCSTEKSFSNAVLLNHLGLGLAAYNRKKIKLTGINKIELSFLCKRV